MSTQKNAGSENEPSSTDNVTSGGDLKFVVETLDIVTGSNPSGFLASGARLKEQPEVEAEVARAEGIKCPRCRNYHTVRGNPKDCCDRCVMIVNEMLPDLVADKRWSEADAEEWRGLVRAAVARYKR